MINNFMPDYKLDRLEWRGDDLAPDVPDLMHPYLFIVDATDQIFSMYSEPLLECDYPVLSVHKPDAFRWHNGTNTVFTKRGHLSKRWIPEGYKFECYQLESGYDYFALVVVSRKEQTEH